METIRKRDINLDVIRITAFLLVVMVHFFTGIGFYLEPINNFGLFVLLMIRNTAMTCVPLFLMISGALLNKRTLCVKHYFGIVRIIVIYLFIALLSICYKHFVLDEQFSIRTFFGSITNYYANDYSFFVSLYLGLFILIPFINLSYNNLSTNKQKLVFVFTLFALSHLYSLVNIRVHLYSFFFETFYPITYYVLGAYLYENTKKEKPGKNALILTVVILVFGIFNYFYCEKGTFNWPDFANYDGFETFIIAWLIFRLLLSIEITVENQKKAVFLSTLSKATFSAFLISWIVDNEIYVHLRAVIPEIASRNIWILATVPVSFILSLLIGLLIDKILNPVIDGIKRIHSTKTEANAE